MDGVFVPNISFGMPVISAMKKHAKKPLDVHLMIVNPDQYISTFKNIGADILTVHYEACSHLHRTLQAIKAEGMKAGVALNPHTPIHLLEDIIHDAEVELLAHLAFLPVEDYLVKAIDTTEEGLDILHCDVVVIVLENLLEELEFPPGNGLEHKLRIWRVVEE